MSSPSLPRVSVCLLTYKRAELLPSTLEHLLAQTHADFELIICDDCSPDHTEQVGRAFERRDARVRYVRNPENLRYANNQNAAILRARHEHVAIVHDGDVYHPNLLTEWTRALVEQPSAALVFNRAEYMNQAREVVGVYEHPYQRLTPGRQLVDDILFRPSSPIFGITMVRRSRVLEVGPFDPRLPTLADIDMWLRLLLRYDAAYVSEPLYAIMTREEDHHNNYTNWRVRAEAELIHALNWHRRFEREPDAAEPARRAIARMLYKQRALQLAVCLRYRKLDALREGLTWIAKQPPFGAQLHRESVTSWAELARRIGESPQPQPSAGT